MSVYATPIAKDTIRIERLLPGPIERVWAYLTESEKRGQWLASGAMDLRPGGAVQLNFRHADLSPEREEVPEKYKQYDCGAEMTGTIIACDPPRLLTHSWSEGDDGVSEVTYALEERGDKVLLTLTHRRLPSRETLIGVCGGWHTHLDILVDRLEGRTPKPFWGVFVALDAHYRSKV